MQTSGGFDIDATVEGSLKLPALPEPALTLRDLDRAIQIARARPPEVDFRPLDPGSYGIGLPGGVPTRVTTDAEVFEFSSDNFQLFLLVATRSARFVWMAPAKATMAGESHGCSSVSRR